MYAYDGNIGDSIVFQNISIVEIDAIAECELQIHILYLRYRDTAVVFSLTLASLFIKFRIRLPNTADRCSLCLALSEFVPVQESLPVI